MNAPNSEAQLREHILGLVQKYAGLTLAPKGFSAGVTPIPPPGKVLGAKELQNLVEASLDGWLTTGRLNEAFEKSWLSSSAWISCSLRTRDRRPTFWRSRR